MTRSPERHRHLRLHRLEGSTRLLQAARRPLRRGRPRRTGGSCASASRSTGGVGDRHAGRRVLLRLSARPRRRHRGASRPNARMREHDWPDGADVRVRMGLHTGEPSVGDEGYLGLDVVRAARLSAAGQRRPDPRSPRRRGRSPASSLPEGVTIFPLGERQLKDIDEPERVFELEIDGVTPPKRPCPPLKPAAPKTSWRGGRSSASGWRRDIRASVPRQLGRGVARARRCRTSTRLPTGRRSVRDEIAVQVLLVKLAFSASTSRTPRSRVRISACAREESSEQSSGRVRRRRCAGDGAPATSSANSARETASAPATCSGPRHVELRQLEQRGGEVADLDGAADLVREEGDSTGSRAASSCFDGSAPP